MEARSTLRSIIAALVGLGIVVLFIVLMVRIFTHHGGPATPAIDLGKYSDTSSEVRLLIDAPTNVDQDHRQIRITVSGTLNQIEIIQGYQGAVIDSRSYPSNSAAYATFLQSLKLANFTKGNTKSTSDYRGYCPQGDRYVYTFNDGYKDLFTYWSTTCGQGTYSGNQGVTRQLFIKQIPAHDFSQLTSSIPLN
jgi:hypothetical protein